MTGVLTCGLPSGVATWDEQHEFGFLLGVEGTSLFVCFSFFGNGHTFRCWGRRWAIDIQGVSQTAKGLTIALNQL